MPPASDFLPGPIDGNADAWIARLAALSPQERQKQLAELETVNTALASLLRAAFEPAPGPAWPGPASPIPSHDLAAGDRFGSYVILGKLGSGGFGSVYKAEQRDPVRRTVALKVIKPGVDTKEVIARFDSERQALARMGHPHIARVLDAGATDAGRPYFVMEHVPGVPITQFADEHRLTLEQRLGLFGQVCDAITHAHQKAIIHRDIKASNVLAFMRDGKATAKVIDFGIAKALTSDRLTDLTFNTGGGMVVGTYTTMSPEQAAGSPDIDTRTDVYSLGVLLYELLTGLAPFDPAQLRSSTEDEIRRLIREVDPPTPSTRLTTFGADAGEKLARSRQLRHADLCARLRSELEWIPLKAMRKERDRRYAGAAELREDLGRYLAGEPLLAGPESRAYRVRKLTQQHRGLLAAAAAVFLALLLGLAGTMWGLDRARSQARVATQEARRAEAAEQEALGQRDTAARANQFLADLFEVYRPEHALGHTPTAQDVLDHALDTMETRYPEPSQEKAFIQYSLAKLYESLGDFQTAAGLVRSGLDTRRSLLGPQHPATLEAQDAYAGLLSKLGDHEAAEALFRRTLTAQREVLGDCARPTLETMQNHALSLKQLGRYEESEPLYRSALDGYRQEYGPEHGDTLSVQANYAMLLYHMSESRRAAPLIREVLHRRSASLGADQQNHPTILDTKGYYALILGDLGEYEQARTLYLEVIEGRTAVYGEHPATARALHNYALFLADRPSGSGDPESRNDPAEAVGHLRRAVGIAERHPGLGPRHPDTVDIARALAHGLTLQGDLEAADRVRIDFGLDTD